MDHQDFARWERARRRELLATVEIRTWADAYGNWHARAEFPRMTISELRDVWPAMRLRMRDAIMSELVERAPDGARPTLRVRTLARSAYLGWAEIGE